MILSNNQIELLVEMLDHSTFLSREDSARHRVETLLKLGWYIKDDKVILNYLRTMWIQQLNKNKIDKFFVDMVCSS